MDNQPKILQQRVQIGSVRRREWQESFKWVAGKEKEGDKAQIQQAHHTKHTGAKRVGIGGVGRCNRCCPGGHNERPQ